MGILKKYRIYKAIKERNYRELSHLMDNYNDENIMLYYALQDAKINKVNMLSQAIGLAHDRKSIISAIKEYKKCILENEERLTEYYYFIIDILVSKTAKAKIGSEYVEELEIELFNTNNAALITYYIKRNNDKQVLETLKEMFKNDKDKLNDFLNLISSQNNRVDDDCSSDEYIIFADSCFEIDNIHDDVLIKVKDELGKLVNER